MAIEQNLDEEKKKQEAMGSNAPQLTSSPVTGSSSGINMDQSESSKGSGRAPNVRNFIEANKGEADKMVGRIGKSGEDTASQIRSAVEGRKQEFGSQASNIRNAAQTGVQAAQNIVQNASSYVPKNNQELEQNKQQEVQSFQKAYTGLNDEVGKLNTDLSKINQQTQGLNQFADRAQTETGRFQLLRDVLGRSPGENYTRGQQRLDQLLVQGSQGAGKQLNQQLSGYAQDVNEKTQGLNQFVTDEYGNVKNLAQEASGNIRNMFDTGIKSVEQQVRDRASQRDQLVNQYTGFADRFKNANITSDDIDFLKGKGHDFLNSNMDVYNMDFSKYINSENMRDSLLNKSENQFAKADEIAKYNALQDLSQLQGNMNLEEFQDPFSINSQGFVSDLENQRNAAQSGYNSDTSFRAVDPKYNYNLGPGSYLAVPGLGTVDFGRMTPEQATYIVNNSDKLGSVLRNTGSPSGSGMSSRLPGLQSDSAVRVAQGILDQYKNKYGIGKQLSVAQSPNTGTNKFNSLF